MIIFRKYKYLATILVLLLVHSSCKKDFLEIDPKGKKIAKKTQDFERILNAASISTSYTASVFFGDEMALFQPFVEGASLRTQRLFRYEDRVYNIDELPIEITDGAGYVKNLYLFNKVINEVKDSEDGTEDQKNALAAQAKVGRAICNLMFANDFALPYDPANASTTMGIPLITLADVTSTEFVRKSLHETYDFVIKDLTDALPNLGPLTHRRKLSRLAAEFYLTRAYLYMGKFAEATEHLNSAFDEVSKSTIPLQLYDYNVVLNSPDNPNTWLPLGFFGLENAPTSADNTQTIYNVESSLFQFDAANTFLYSPQTAILFGYPDNEAVAPPADKRVNLFEKMEFFGDKNFPKGMRRYPGFNLDSGPTLQDMYLMRAELRARSGNLTGAVQDLELLRRNRISASAANVPGAVATNQNALMKFIFEERVREFALTGLRWMDMRRLSVDKNYAFSDDFKHEMYDANGNLVGQGFTFKKQRFALKFGERLLSESKGLVDNN